jgi:molybdopterin-containing oxidoreductase family iron-sulfur binding subunit
MKRRDFLKVLGVSGAGAATIGCTTNDVERLIPYVVPADEIVPGVPTFYTSTCRECPAGCGIHVETHEGRVTKVEGNPDHPISHGNLCARGQASVQGLYHPDRVKGPLVREAGVRETNVTWNVAEEQLAQQLRGLQQGGRSGQVVFLTGSYGPTMERLVTEFVAATGARRVIYDVWQDQPRSLDFADADVLVSFGADFLETWGSPVDYAWQFAQMHSYREGRRGKFVWVGPHRPLTGLNADQWVAPKPGTEHILALALAGRVDAAAAAQQTGVDAKVIEQLAAEFRAGKGVALGPGASISGQNAGVLRDAIGALNAGRPGASPAPATPSAEVAALVQQMNAGQVRLLLVDAPNPVYTLPASLGFAEAMKKVPTRVGFSAFPDETAALCSMILPNHHFLEAWDDYQPRADVAEIVQPAMRPVFNTKQTGDVLLSVMRQIAAPGAVGTATTYYDYLRAAWAGQAGGADGWREAIKRGGSFAATGGGTGAAGFLPLVGATAAPATGAPAAAAPAAAAPPPATPAPVAAAPSGAISTEPMAFEGADGADLHLVVYPSYRFFDGRTANRPWLLELPDPVSKVPWDSWIEIHPRTAERLGVEQGDQVELSSPYGKVQSFALLYPGVRQDTVAVQTGLGHDASGRWTEGVGVNPNVLLGPSLQGSYGVRVALRRVGGPPMNGPWIPGKGIFEQGNRSQHSSEVAQVVSVAQLKELESRGEGEIPGAEERIRSLKGYGGFVPVETPTDPSEYPPPGTRYGQYLEHATRWAMAIDLSRCIGCAACVTACQAENNIPVVGPKETKRGRDLQWLRIERYFKTGNSHEAPYEDDATDDVRFLPMLCQHCGNAPCEPVCPVYAAYHTPDGLNGQVYNRCVGTRYCANNCPYKVRVFNWWTYEFVEPLNWQLNPDVTVREKGVMEKCTFCVQRIREAEHTAARQNRPVRDGEVVPACVQTCPTEAFVFGNIQDPDSKVAQAARSVRGYRVLEELNTQPAIVYLKKVTLAEPAEEGHEVLEATRSGPN